MVPALISCGIAALVAVAGSLYRLGNTIGELAATVHGLDDDLRDVRLVTDRQGNLIAKQDRRLTILEAHLPTR